MTCELKKPLEIEEETPQAEEAWHPKTGICLPRQPLFCEIPEWKHEITNFV
jgi:hypothetical protein